MASIGTVIRQALEASATLTAVLTGGIYDASELGRQGLTPDATGLYTGQVLNPCAIIRGRGANPFGPHYTADNRSERAFFEIYFYEDNGFVNVDNALNLTKKLLDRSQHTADNGSIWWVNWVNDSGELDAPEYGAAAMKFSRYELIYVRR